MISLEQLTDMFLEATENMKIGQTELFSASEAVIVAEQALGKAKDVAIRTGKIDGKNEKEREAQLHEKLAEFYGVLNNAEGQLRRKKFAFEQYKITFDLSCYLLRIHEVASRMSIRDS